MRSCSRKIDPETKAAIIEQIQWKQVRPTWCPYQDCQFKAHSQDSVCVGKLPKPELHDDTFNTHRFCLHGAKDDGEWTFDLKANRSDVYNITRILNQVAE